MGTKGTAVLTIPEAAAILEEKHGIKCSIAVIRRRVDKMELGGRFGPYRIIDAREVEKLAKVLKKEGFSDS